jgi:hypothetical protein
MEKKKWFYKERITGFRYAIILLFGLLTTIGCQHHRRNFGPSTLGEDKGNIEYQTPLFKLSLLNSSQTVSALKTNDNDPFDFTPGDRLKERDKNSFYHLGDITLGIRTADNAEWSYYSTSKNRNNIDAIKPDNPDVISAADLSKTLPAEIPVQVIRYWEKDGDNLVMRFELKNKSDKPVELGALGIPMVFNNNFNDKTLDQAHAENVFFDPYIGKDAGYLQVIRLNGNGKVLLVVPYGKTPFEAYRPLLDEPIPCGYTFEGLHEWMVHSKAYAETEWKGVEQWNEPTSEMLNPGESKSFGVKFLLANSIRDIETTLEQANRPATVGIPGYVVPMDVNAKLFLRYQSAIKSMTTEPEGALEITASNTTSHGWVSYEVKGKKWGRVRLTIDYEDGLSQTINYKVIAPEKEVIASYGNFLTTKQWFSDLKDPFGRAPSVITYDYEEKKQVTQDPRAWIPGLCDEGGAGSWLGAIMKQLVMPDKEEVAKLEDFVNKTIWGKLQYSEGPKKYGVRKSLFYYEPDSMPKGTYSDSIKYGRSGGFPSWNRQGAESVDRSYNYPHVAAAYWVMYRLARNYQGLTTQQNWQWYLEHAFHTTMAMINQAPYYAQFGQMEGTIFILILKDLKAEGLTKMAVELEAVMKTRVEAWKKLNYPFGSEMPWDSTGQEEVYMWAKYFGLDDKAIVTLNAVLAYMPTVPHWAYNGNARRYWDFQFGGKITRFERMIHHYGSGLNAIPVLYAYRETPSDFYLLRVGYGGLMGTISNITQDGFAPCAFHSYPSTLKNDGISGDYGSGFFGYAVNTSSYLIHHNEFGWLAFGGNLTENGNWVKIELTTAAKSRVYISLVGLWLTLDAGQFKSVSYNTESGEIKMEFEKADSVTNQAFLNILTTSKETSAKEYFTGSLVKNERGSYSIPLKNENFTVSLKPKN